MVIFLFDYICVIAFVYTSKYVGSADESSYSPSKLAGKAFAVLANNLSLHETGTYNFYSISRII